MEDCMASLKLGLIALLPVACALGDQPGSKDVDSPAVAVGLAVVGSAVVSPARPVTPLFTELLPAPRGAALRVFVDPDRIVGWIAGSRSHAGEQASIRYGGKDHIVDIDRDNTFALAYDVAKATEAVITVRGMRQRVTLEPRAELEPTAFFVIDRGAYRPGQKLSFVAFLRRATRDGYEALPGRPVEVRIVSETKKTTAAKLALVADERGRITGDYTFSPADPLDDYSLSIPGHRGTARVTLAELRKPKVKLEIEAAIGAGTGAATGARDAVLQFRAIDFLDKPVGGGTVEYTAQIVREPPAARGDPLSRDAFAFGNPAIALTATELVAFAARPEHAAHPAGGWREVVFEDGARLEVAANGTASRTIPLQGGWLRGDHSLLIDAVIVDANGREQRTTRAIPLIRPGAQLEIRAPHELASTGPIDVAVRALDARGQPLVASTSVIALRVPSTTSHGLGWDMLGNEGSLYGSAGNLWDSCFHTSTGCWGRRTHRITAPALRSSEPLAAAAVVVDGVASLRLNDPGAYRLVAIAKLADGSSMWAESGVAVRALAELPDLVLELERTQVRHGERLIGTLHARHRDASALIVVRDARGIVSRSRVKLADGRARIDLPVGDTLGYGAAIEAYLLGTGGTVHAAQRLVEVAQSSRELAIRTHTKETYGPGQTVELDVDVGRAEAVDLVVSVFDQSLLGVSQDRAVDPTSFYYADDRLRARAGVAALRAELGDVTIGALHLQAKTYVARPLPDGVEHPPEWARAGLIISAVDSGRLDAWTLVALLRQAGVHAVAPGPSSWHLQLDEVQRKQLAGKRLVDVLEAAAGALAFLRVADTTVILDPSQPAGHPAALRTGPSGISGNAVHSAPVASTPRALDVVDGSTDVVRRDFSDSAFFDGRLRTGPDGKLRIRFKLPDSLTSWQVVVTAIGGDMRVGRHVARLRTIRDVMVWPMIPRLFTEGDTVSVFASVHNHTAADRALVVSIETENVDVLSPASQTVRVPRGRSTTVTWSVRAKGRGVASLVMRATAAGGGPSDASLKRIPIVASSAEQVVTASGFADKPLAIELPAGVDPRDATLEITFAPSLAADLVSTLDYLVEYPYGCAEQTMSRFAPAIRVAGILRHLGIRDGALAARLPKVVEAGLKNLTQLQQPDGGWGWQGSSATHEMITPYVMWGLLQAEAAGYKLPDERTIPRGLAKLGAFHEQLARHPQMLTDRAFVMYVSSQRVRPSDAAWAALVEQRAAMTDHALALMLEMASRRGDRTTADQAAAALRHRAQRTGGWAHWRTGGFSRWADDPFEITAAVLKALVVHDADDPLIPEAIAYFVAHKRGDRWNSTKDTAMILFAITEYLGAKGASPTGAGFVEYAVNGGRRARMTFADGLVRKAVVESGLPRRSVIAFTAASPGMMARAVLRYRKTGRDLKPAANGLEVVRTLHLLGARGERVRELRTGERVQRGAYVESIVTVRRASNEPMRFLLIEDPKPAGAEALPENDRRFPPAPPGPHSSRTPAMTPYVLREDREAKLAFHFEDVMATTIVRTVLHLEMAGELALPPAQAELMYETQTRGNSGSLVLRVGDGPG
jgi:Alpha-2-macroglobulin family/Bacterial Alpha-2-macroglobulin MG10 domain/MG2 domain/A-macroglobulin TED domain